MSKIIIHFEQQDVHQPQPWPIGITDGTVTSGLGKDDGATLIGFAERGTYVVKVFAKAAEADPASVVGLVPVFGNGGMFNWDIPVRSMEVRP